MELKGKTILITGETAGIGLESVKHFWIMVSNTDTIIKVETTLYPNL